MIVWNLLDKQRRYKELEQMVEGIPQRVLTQALREMKEDGVLQKIDKHWTLTPLGQRLDVALQDVYRWGEEHAKKLPNR